MGPEGNRMLTAGLSRVFGLTICLDYPRFRWLSSCLGIEKTFLSGYVCQHNQTLGLNLTKFCIGLQVYGRKIWIELTPLPLILFAHPLIR